MASAAAGVILVKAIYWWNNTNDTITPGMPNIIVRLVTLAVNDIKYGNYKFYQMR